MSRRVVAITILLAGVGGLGWVFSRRAVAPRETEERRREDAAADRDPRRHRAARRIPGDRDGDVVAEQQQR
ncbi:MAG: hypothetical protein AABZ01_01485, partial [Gemmatimonadota bacterium]